MACPSVQESIPTVQPWHLRHLSSVEARRSEAEIRIQAYPELLPCPSMELRGTAVSKGVEWGVPTYCVGVACGLRPPCPPPNPPS
jgi:hypothetical protein